jgi:hypothetical protein
VLASTGKWTSRPLGGVTGKGDKGYVFEALEDLPIHDVGHRETQFVWYLSDYRSHSVAPIANSGFKLEETLTPDPQRKGCLTLTMSMTGNAGDVQGFRSHAGSGTANATLPVECARKIKENPLTTATAKTIPSLRPRLDQTDYGTDRVTLNSGASDMVGHDMVVPFLIGERRGWEARRAAQKNIYGFGKLPTRGAGAGDGFSAKEYIKGHLLNDDLGGPGEELNLFPITAAANRAHNRNVEEVVKDLAKGRKAPGIPGTPLVVNYEVHVADPGVRHDIDVRGDGTCKYEYLDADFNCSYGTYTLYTDNTIEPHPTTRTAIHSTFDLSGFLSGVKCP